MPENLVREMSVQNEVFGKHEGCQDLGVRIRSVAPVTEARVARFRAKAVDFDHSALPRERRYFQLGGDDDRATVPSPIFSSRRSRALRSSPTRRAAADLLPALTSMAWWRIAVSMR